MRKRTTLVDNFVSNRVDDERGDSVGGQDDDQTDHTGSQRLFGSADLVVVAGSGHPQETTIENDDDGDQTEEAQQNTNDVGHNLTNVSAGFGIKTDVRTDLV